MPIDPIDPFDINKPISSTLDLGDELFPEPVSIDEPVLDLTDDGLLAYSDRSAEASDGEIYPEREARVTRPKVFKQPQAPQKVNLKKPQKGTQMPAIRAEMSSRPIYAKQPKKVSLEKPKKAPQMPGIRADGSQPPVTPWKSGNGVSQPSASRVPPERRRLGSGTVNFALTGKKNIIMLAVAGVGALCLTGFLFLLFSLMFDSENNYLFESAFTIWLFGAGMFSFFANLVRSGEHWHYEATGREIIFSRRGRPSYIIFYKDVLAVDYAPYKFLGILESGYTITVLAYGKRYEFKYVFPNLARKIPFEYTPFEIIRTQINQLGINN